MKEQLAALVAELRRIMETYPPSVGHKHWTMRVKVRRMLVAISDLQAKIEVECAA